MSAKMETGNLRSIFRVAALSTLFCIWLLGQVQAEEPLVIAASPRLAKPIEAIAHAFEASYPNVRVRIMYASGSFLRGTIAQMQNSGQYGIESGVIHVVAPGDAELLDRLEHKYYVLPETRRPYAVARLALVVPASHPAISFDDFARDTTKRLVVADADVSELGHHTKTLLDALGWWKALGERIEIAHDAQGILDRLAHGEADAGILFQPQAVQAQEAMMVAALAPAELARPVVYEMAMERFCPNRVLCREFLTFSQSAEARAALVRLGYEVPGTSASLLRTSSGEAGAGRDDTDGAAVPTRSWWDWFSQLFTVAQPETRADSR